MEVKVQRERSLCFLIKLRGFRLHSATPETLASRGEEIWLKARSQPTGIFSRGDGAGCTGSSVLSTGAESGRRSPFNVRSTDPEDVKERKPVLGKDGKARKLATKRPETTAATGTNRMRPIGRSADFTPLFSPTHRQQVAREKTKRASASSAGALFSPACDARLTLA